VPGCKSLAQFCFVCGFSFFYDGKMEAKLFDDFEAVECIRTHERVNGVKYKTRTITTGIGTGDVFRRMKNRS